MIEEAVVVVVGLDSRQSAPFEMEGSRAQVNVLVHVYAEAFAKM